MLRLQEPHAAQANAGVADLGHHDAAGQAVSQHRLHAAAHRRTRLADADHPYVPEAVQMQPHRAAVASGDEGVAFDREPLGNHRLRIDPVQGGVVQRDQGGTARDHAVPGWEYHCTPPAAITSRYQKALRRGVRAPVRKSTCTSPNRLR